MREAAEFAIGTLIEAPTGTPFAGRLITNPHSRALLKLSAARRNPGNRRRVRFGIGAPRRGLSPPQLASVGFAGQQSQHHVAGLTVVPSKLRAAARDENNGIRPSTNVG